MTRRFPLCILVCLSPLACGSDQQVSPPPSEACAATDSDALNCGSCGNVCPSLENAAAVCALGRCSFACSTGFGNCDGQVANGCEADLTSPESCGACDNRCGQANAVASCTAGGCALDCNTQYADCNGLSADGCEAELTSVQDCGACGRTCQNVHGTASCADGDCVVTCIGAFADCDGDASNGCETALGTSTHCGGCGHACAPGLCEDGLCAPGILASVDAESFGLAIDSTHAYWSNVEGGTDGGTIMRVALAGGEPEVLATGQHFMVSVALDDTHVYWADFVLGAVMRVPKNGGAISVVAYSLHPWVVALDGDNLYWTDTGADYMQLGEGAIYVVPKNAVEEQNPTVFAAYEQTPVDIAFDDTRVFWTAAGLAPCCDGAVRSAPKLGGGSPASLVSGIEFNLGLNLAVGDGHVYFASHYGVSRIPASGGTVESYVDNENGHGSIALDATHVYWTSDGVARAPKAGGEVQSLATGLMYPKGMAVNDTHIYYLEGGAGKLWALAKP